MTAPDPHGACYCRLWPSLPASLGNGSCHCLFRTLKALTGTYVANKHEYARQHERQQEREEREIRAANLRRWKQIQKGKGERDTTRHNKKKGVSRTGESITSPPNHPRVPDTPSALTREGPHDSTDHAVVRSQALSGPSSSFLLVETASGRPRTHTDTTGDECLPW